MADEFDRLLAEALTPPQRDPDHFFVRRVQAAVALEERLSREREAIVHRLALEIMALAAVAAGVLWLGQAPQVASRVAESPWLAASILLSGFGFLVALLATKDTAEEQEFSRFSSLTS